MASIVCRWMIHADDQCKWRASLLFADHEAATDGNLPAPDGKPLPPV
jgi:hypothetical protein